MPGPPPPVARTRRAVRTTLAAAALPPGALVLAAVSGGPDSLALAAALAFVAPRAGLRAGAVVVDHGLQDGSAQVAAEAARRCAELGLGPVLVRRVDVETGTGDGPEMAARTARHAAFEQALADTGATHLLLGHTRDDQAEQVLLGLLRGSGARSLAGMAPASGHLLRPFLDLPRTDTAAACAAAGLEPWHDPHNHDPRYTRVRARRLLAALEDELGPVTANLARSATLLRRDDDALDALARQALEAAGPDPAVADLAPLPPAVRTRALRTWLLREGAAGAALAAVHLQQVDALVTDWRGQGPAPVPGGLQVRRQGERLVAEPVRLNEHRPPPPSSTPRQE